MTPATTVCSAHFKDEDFYNTDGIRRRLKKGAVPSVFNWSSNKRGRKPPAARPPPEATITLSASTSTENTQVNVDAEYVVPVMDHDYTVPSTDTEQQLEAARARITRTL